MNLQLEELSLKINTDQKRKSNLRSFFSFFPGFDEFEVKLQDLQTEDMFRMSLTSTFLHIYNTFNITLT